MVTKRRVNKAKTSNRTVQPKAKLRPRKSKEETINNLKDTKSIHDALEKLEKLAASVDVDSKAVNKYLITKRKEQGRDFDSNEQSRLDIEKEVNAVQDETQFENSDDSNGIKDFVTRAAERATPFTTSKAVEEGSYAKSRKFADTDFTEAQKCIEALEDHIADATKQYLKSKRKLILLTKTLERAYQDMDNNESTLTEKEVSEFNVAHLSRRLFSESLN